jgi:hypothetical protein
MDKQQADNIDHKIRQAAAHSDPPFKEEAWQRMEVKLDEDLNKRRRRGFIWWWMFGALILGGGLGVYLYQQVYRKGTEERKEVKITSGMKVKLPGSTRRQDQVSTNTGGKVSLKHPEIAGWDDDYKPGVQVTLNKRNHPLQQQKYFPGEKESETVGRNEDDIMNEPVEPPPTGIKAPSEANDLPATDSAREGNPADLKPLAAPAKDSVTTATTGRRKQEKTSGFYFIPSVAMDATSLKRFRIKQMRPVFGAAIGYRINNRLGVQTGFYAGKKVYQAGPGDYKTKPGSYLSMVEIIRIGADCNIYEIPLSVRYDILAGKRSRIYAVSGLTSVIMKRETYDYHYRSNGMYRMMDTTYNGNKHLFSVLNVSAGYEHRIFKTLHIQAEPYMNIPLSGIGEGKVKLYSAGLRAGIKYTPVKKNKYILK